MSRTIAVADIGGTHARFALAQVDEGRIDLGEAVTLRTADHAAFNLAWEEFGRAIGTGLPDELGIAFAGPAGGDTLRMTNNPWVIHLSSLERELGIRKYSLINDVGAIAHAAPLLEPEHFDHLCGPEEPLPGKGVTSVIGLGTGLGIAMLARSPDYHHVIETEGGHVDFAPLDEIEDSILAQLRQRFGRVSVERIACGSGLPNLRAALAAIEGNSAPAGDDRQLWSAALDGSDSLAAAALDRLFLTLGSVAGDVALIQGANAVIVAGGLGHRLRHRFADSGFAKRFVAKGRFEPRMRSIPVKLLNHPQPALLGAAAAFAREHP
jgi:glucokinase